jgi:DDE domain
MLRSRCRHRPIQYLNNVIEQDRRAIKRRVNSKQGFREFYAAGRTIQGYRGDAHNSEGPSAMAERERRPASESVHQPTLRSCQLRSEERRLLREFLFRSETCNTALLCYSSQRRRQQYDLELFSRKRQSRRAGAQELFRLRFYHPGWCAIPRKTTT